MASTLTPSLGKAHACNTSLDPTSTRVVRLIGKITLLSTSSNRYLPGSRVSLGVRKESNSTWGKSAYW